MLVNLKLASSSGLTSKRAVKKWRAKRKWKIYGVVNQYQTGAPESVSLLARMQLNAGLSSLTHCNHFSRNTLYFPR